MLELLASHYGTQLAEDEQGAAAKNDIDSGSFDPDAFTRGLLADKSLPDLIAFQETMAKKARSLDSSMQNLVYENYNKFIRATETIRQMRDSVGELESEMSTLRGAIDRTGSTSSRLSEALHENRSKIEVLGGVRTLIGKLEFLFQLPARLRSCMELGAHQQAVRYYRGAAVVLRSHASVASFRAIAEEADAIAQELRERLRVPLDDASSRAADVAESARLLILLGDDPAPLLADFLSWHKRRLAAALRAAVEEAGAAGDEPAGGPEEAAEAAVTAHRVGDAETVVVSMNRCFVDAFVRTARAFDALRDLAEKEAERREEAGVATAAGSPAAGAVAALQGELESLAAESFSQYFAAVRRALGRTDSLAALLAREAAEEDAADRGEEEEEEGGGGGKDDAGGAGVGASVVRAVERMLVAVRVPARLVPGAELTDKAEATAVAVLRSAVQGVFEALRLAVSARVGAALAACSASSASSVEPPLAPKLEAAEAAGRGLRGAGTALANSAVGLLRCALAESRPVMVGGMRVLPDYSRGFPGMLHGNALSAVLWLSAVADAVCDPQRRHAPADVDAAARAVAAVVGRHDGTDASSPAAASSPVVLRAARAAASALPRMPALLDAVDSLALASTGAPGERLGPGAAWLPSHAPVCAGQPTPAMAALRSAARHRAHVGVSGGEVATALVLAALPLLGRPAGGGSASVRAAEGAIMLGCFAEKLGGGGARACLEALASAFPSRSELLAAGAAGAEDDMEAHTGLTGDAMGAQERELATQALVTAARLADAAGAAAGSVLESALARSARAADWAGMEEPRGCRPAVGLAVREAAALWAVLRGAQSGGARAEASAAAGGDAGNGTGRGLDAGLAPRPPPDGDDAAGAAAGGGAGGEGEGDAGSRRASRGAGLEGDLDRLFASEDTGAAGGAGRRAEWEAVGALPLASEPVVAAAVRAAAWGLAEALRDVDDMGEHGYSQAQVDVAVLASAAASLLRGRRWRGAAEAALGEALSSAADRAQPGAAMRGAVVLVAAKGSLRAAGVPEDGSPLSAPKRPQPAPEPAAPRRPAAAAAAAASDAPEGFDAASLGLAADDE